MKISARRWRKTAPVQVALGLAALGAISAYAQSGQVEVTVEYVAGSNIYIDAGRERGILEGDTVLVYNIEGGPPLGTLRVVGASADKAVLTFSGDAFPVTRGDRLRLSFEAAVIPSVAGEAAPPSQERLAAGGGGGGGGGGGPRVTGRLSLDVDLLRSQIDFPDSELASKDRSFALPALGLRAAVTGLPGGLVANTNVRLSYRYSSSQGIDPETSARVYELNVGKTFGEGVLVQVGRFYNPFERFSGYWDGVLVRVGGRGLGAGFASGFEPDLADESFDSSLPKYTAFVDYHYAVGSVLYHADVSFHQVRPQNGLEDHTFFGWAQRIRLGTLRLSSDLQVDRDPNGGEWTVTELFANASLPLLNRLYLDGRYSRRRPYLIWRGELPIGEQRDQAGVGLTYRAFGGFVNADITTNRWEDGERSLTYSAGLAVPRTAFWDVGLNASASYWKRDGSDALLVSPGLNRHFGRVVSRFGYQLYRSGNPSGTVETHAADLQLSFPLASRTYSSIGAQARFGGGLSSQSLRATIWMSF